MALNKACIQNNEAIGLLTTGRLENAVLKWREALAIIQKAVDSSQAPSECPADTLVTSPIEGLHDEHHIISMFDKVFALADTSTKQDENLLAALLLYNIAVAYSLQRKECSAASRVFNLYRLSLQILRDSDLMWQSNTSLLLMALYNNIAHMAFCVHETAYAVYALEELTLLLMDESVKANLTSNAENFEFFYRNTLVLASRVGIATSPAA
ncbi:hypothetical protein FisN_2Hh371 [Fistulifera solaris]|jgi:hypothetical protein|uniref:Uncharacterized protein n=1 Tax=Fistulifera solaris TaxID=1519565 RepID=A0A1Z5KK92_FISSO|nr:hypothetical protein FisN_2Hh371 [Fistulifera solaris]|eukprot:GAX26686.1 hypothetical protein FisN_2Hh371 [Fistulifera solaris]